MDQALAATTILERRQMRASLLAWSTHRRAKVKDREGNPQVPALHHRMLLEHIQSAIDSTLVHPETGDPCSNLIFLLPPGAAKSTYLSVDCPPWVLQRKPGWRVLACSHKADLIERFSRECRNSVEEDKHILGYMLRSDSKAVQEWNTTNGGGYQCAGVGAGISGNRAYFGAIDDYLGSREDADSKLIRDKQWHWYWNDFWPRLVPGAVQIIVANRQHEDDLVGRLLDSQASKWVLVRIPFFAEDNDPIGRQKGEHIWPEWNDARKVQEVKDLQFIEPRTYAGLYQQRPAPEEGNYFKKDFLKGYTELEYQELMKLEPRIYIGCDFAVSEEKDANRCCFIPAAVGPDNCLYVLPDIFWKIAGPKTSSEAWLEMMRRRNPMMVWAEKGHISKSIGPFLKERMREENVFSYIVEITPRREKDVRARAIQNRAAMGMVKFPTWCSWWNEAQHELLTFPGGKTDDFVDALSMFGLGLQQLVKTQQAKVPEEEKLDYPFVPTGKWLKESSQNKQPTTKYGGR